MQNMSRSLKIVAEKFVLDLRKGDKYLTSLVTNAFNNICAKKQFINEDTVVSNGCSRHL